MRIAIIGPVYPYKGGIAHFTAFLSQAFQDEGHTVKLISFRGSYPRWIYKGNSTFDISKIPISYPAEYVLDYKNPFSWKRASRRIIDFNPDVVLISWWTPFWGICFGSIIRQLRNKPFSIGYLVHNLYPHERHWYDNTVTRWALKETDWLVALSQTEVDKAISAFPYKPIISIPHPLYFFPAGEIVPKAEARRNLNIPANKLVALFFGIVRPYKGLRYLLEATQKCVSRDIPLLTIIAGEFWEGIEQTREYIRSMQLENAVRLENRYISNEEVALLLLSADVFIAPYLSGTQSGALKTAMGANLPIIASDVIVDKLMLSEYPKMRVVPSGNSDEIARNIEELFAKNDQQENPTQNGMTWADWVNTFVTNIDSK